MKVFNPSFLSLAASALLATSAYSQGLCNFSDNFAPPNDPFVGQWVFHWENLGSFFDGVGSNAAAIGSFDVQRGVGNYLTVIGNMTVNAGGRIVRLSGTSTRNRGPLAQYQCINGTSIIQGGSFHLSDGSQDTIWQFVFKDNTFSEIFMVDEEYIDNVGLSHVLRGNAVRINTALQTANCNFITGGGVPALLNNAMQFNLAGDPTPWWSLQTQDSGNPFALGTTAAIGALTFLPSTRPGLVGTVTSASGVGNQVNHTRLAPTAGSYQVNQCFNNAGTSLPGNGGNMSLQVGPYAAQYEYIFSTNNLSMAFILSLTTTGRPTFGQGNIGDSDILYGTLNRWN